MYSRHALTWPSAISMTPETATLRGAAAVNKIIGSFEKHEVTHGIEMFDREVEALDARRNLIEVRLDRRATAVRARAGRSARSHLR